MFIRAQFSSQVASATDFLVTILLVKLFGVYYVYATFTGSVCGGIVNCIINYKWTFKSKECKKRHVIVKYLLVWIGSILLNTWGIYFMTETISRNPWVQETLKHYIDDLFVFSKIVVSLLVGFLWNYNMQRIFVYKNCRIRGTILDNLRWGDENASEEECIRVAKLACADEFIERFPDKYNTWIEQGGSNVSGGQKQRLTIARALLRKPKVLILDDSTSAVDTATDAKIRKAFREEIPGTTKIIIAQRISSVQDADRILVLDNGQINGLGTHEELLKTNKIYQEVYNSQTQGGGDFDKQGGEQ